MSKVVDFVMHIGQLVTMVMAVLFLVAVLWAVGAVGYTMYRKSVDPPMAPLPTDMVQQVACEYQGYLSFVATDVRFHRWHDGSMEFRTNEGMHLLYKMRHGELCGWNPSILRSEADKLTGG